MDLSDIDLPILVSGSLMVLGFLIGCSRGRDFWLFVDFLATGAFGLAWYFIPHILLGFQTNVTLDGTHLTYTRTFGACMIGDAVSRYTLRSSKDKTAQVFLLLSRIIGCTILLVAMVYSQWFGGDAWSQNHIFFGMVGNLLWMMGSVVYYYQARFTGGHVQLESRLNLHLRLDACLMLLMGCTIYAFPDCPLKVKTTLETFDPVHLHMVRSVGAMLIGSSIQSFLAPGFLFDWDKRAVLLGRLVTLLAAVPWGLYACWTYEEWGNNLHVSLLLETGVILNALLGYYAPHETERYKGK